MNKEEQYLNAMAQVAYNAIDKEWNNKETGRYDCLVLANFLFGKNTFFRPNKKFEYTGFVPVQSSIDKIKKHFTEMRINNQMALTIKDMVATANRATKEGNV